MDPKSFLNTLPDFWPIEQRAKLPIKSGVIELVDEKYSPTNFKAIGFPKKIAYYYLELTHKDQVESILNQICDWFQANNFKQSIINDLFFGCGMMLFHHSFYVRNVNLIERSLYTIFKSDDDQQIQHLFTKLIDLLGKEQLEFYQGMKKEIVLLESKFKSNCNSVHVDRYNKILSEHYGQKIELHKRPRIKYPKDNLRIAGYLIGVLAKTSQCNKNTRYKENGKDSTNTKLAANKLLELTKIYGIPLPRDLRKRI